MHVALFLTALVSLAADPLGPGDHTRKISFDGIERNYLVHVPPQYDPARPTPVVLVFHGGGSNAQQMMRFCGMNKKADEAGFIAVYPNGTGRTEILLTFNGGNCCGYAETNNVDDVGFTRAILDELATLLTLDPRRVFATGMSNGGIMAYRLASELSDRIAAIAPVSGPMGTETCQPKRPVPVMHFHGTLDQFAPFAGGRGARSISRINFYSVEHSIAAWIKADGCPPTPVVEKLPDAADDGMTVTRKTYGPGREGSEVALIEIEGGGHTWPGEDPRLRFLGPATRDISANDLMWEFFQKHPLK
jgi:polyhydroxybutyrate depolymerase